MNFGDPRKVFQELSLRLMSKRVDGPESERIREDALMSED
jgi:hypothetical protein